ncbi:pentapeptide repeat-containing protein [Streptomyces sp. NPDC050204]|uniref:pentapeptide repeat-containing protein n=1 Tax=Streptomyces sp. NPDC050204 TaxID=3155514 RepID=UPI00342ECBF7
MASLSPGADIDHRGTPFTDSLLRLLIRPLRDPTTGRTHFGAADFKEASFSGPARFGLAQFSGNASFYGAQFADWASFNWTRFAARASFGKAQFLGDAFFEGTQFSGYSWFSEARFALMSTFGPVVCAKRVDLSGALFEAPATLEIAALEVLCQRTQWESTATLRLRYAAVDLNHAVLSAPLAITFHTEPFTRGRLLDERLLASFKSAVQVVSVRGVNAAHLVMTDIDLSDCLFSGAFHLDQLRLEGRCTFARPPIGLHRHFIWPYRWTRRRALAEEHHWRAERASEPAPHPPLSQAGSPRHWRTRPNRSGPGRTPGPDEVAAVYRQLRKAFEDSKNEPGAADFYYGEMEMRRHDSAATSKGERCLLWGYWLLSGYGLRASRAIGWLLAIMSLTVLLLMGIGLPSHNPDPTTIGTLQGGKITLHTKTSDPALHGTWSQHVTWARAEKASRVAVNSVVFRTSGQYLTTAGTYIEMASRLLEPALLALAILSARGRIKR